MLTFNTKKLAFDEVLKLNDDKEYMIQITPEEMKWIKELYSDKKDICNEDVEAFVKVLFKDNLEEIKSLCPGSEFDRLVETVGFELLGNLANEKKTLIESLNMKLPKTFKR